MSDKKFDPIRFPTPPIDQYFREDFNEINAFADLLVAQVAQTQFYHNTDGRRFWEHPGGALECKACGGLSFRPNVLGAPNSGVLTPDLEQHTDDCEIRQLVMSDPIDEDEDPADDYCGTAVEGE